jgi:hypothetical protein
MRDPMTYPPFSQRVRGYDTEGQPHEVRRRPVNGRSWIWCSDVYPYNHPQNFIVRWEPLNVPRPAGV